MVDLPAQAHKDISCPRSVAFPPSGLRIWFSDGFPTLQNRHKQHMHSCIAGVHVYISNATILIQPPVPLQQELLLPFPP